MTDQTNTPAGGEREALQKLLDHYTALVNSGDAGNWNPEAEPVVIAARVALAQPAEDYKSIFEDAARDMAAIDEALGIDPEEAGGAEPILNAIEELRAALAKQGAVDGLTDEQRGVIRVAIDACNSWGCTSIANGLRAILAARQPQPSEQAQQVQADADKSHLCVICGEPKAAHPSTGCPVEVEQVQADAGAVWFGRSTPRAPWIELKNLEVENARLLGWEVIAANSRPAAESDKRDDARHFDNADMMRARRDALEEAARLVENYEAPRSGATFVEVAASIRAIKRQDRAAMSREQSKENDRG